MCIYETKTKNRSGKSCPEGELVTARSTSCFVMMINDHIPGESGLTGRKLGAVSLT